MRSQQISAPAKTRVCSSCLPVKDTATWHWDALYEQAGARAIAIDRLLVPGVRARGGARQSDRRKFSRSCFSISLRPAKFFTTPLASEPPLPCSSIAVIRFEVRLRERATGRATASADREERVDAAVRCSISVPHESRLAHRPIHRDEGRHSILGAVGHRERHLRVVLWTRSADLRLRVATAAAVEIHPRAEAVAHIFGLREVQTTEAVVLLLCVGQAAQRGSGAGRADADARILRATPPAATRRWTSWFAKPR
jgi:hypothetical protein